MRHTAILAALLLAGCGNGGSGGGTSGGWPGGGPATVSMNAGDWDFRNDTGAHGHPDAGPSFLWTSEVDYLTTDVSIAATQSAKATVKIETVSGTPTFVAADGCS